MYTVDFEKQQGIFKQACKIAGWETDRVCFSRSGTKQGRPVWEIVDRKRRERYMFTAFDPQDIYDMNNEVHNEMTFFKD